MTFFEAVVYLIIGYFIGQGLACLGANISKGIKEGLHEIAHTMRRKEE